MSLTDQERLALIYMTDKMWTDALRVGRAVWEGTSEADRRGSYLPGIGAAVLGSLRRKGLAQKIMPDRLWRLTQAGRDTLEELIR
jgi:hypothetical protein